MARPRLPVYSTGGVRAERTFTTISFNEQNPRQKQHKSKSADMAKEKKTNARRCNFTSFGN